MIEKQISRDFWQITVGAIIKIYFGLESDIGMIIMPDTDTDRYRY